MTPSTLIARANPAPLCCPQDERLRGEKKDLYAENAIPVYWLINLEENQIEVYTEPTGMAEVPTYRGHQAYAAADNIPLIIDGQQLGLIPVAGLLP